MHGRGPAAAVAAILSVIVSVGASGCGGSTGSTAGPSPGALGSSAVSPGPPVSGVAASSQSTAASVRSTAQAVDPNSDAAIIAAARGYLVAQEDAVRNGDFSLFAAVTTPKCNCRIGVQAVSDYLKQHRYHEDVTYRLDADPRIIARSASHADVNLKFSSGPYRIFDANAHVVHTVADDSGNFIISFEKQGDKWLAFLSTNS